MPWQCAFALRLFALPGQFCKCSGYCSTLLGAGLLAVGPSFPAATLSKRIGGHAHTIWANSGQALVQVISSPPAILQLQAVFHDTGERFGSPADSGEPALVSSSCLMWFSHPSKRVWNHQGLWAFCWTVGRDWKKARSKGAHASRNESRTKRKSL